MHRIPLTTNARLKFATRVEGHEFAFNIWWQPQTQSWHANIDIDGTRITSGQAVLAGVPMLRIPQTSFGEFIPLPLTENANAGEIGRFGWDRDYALYHFSIEDIVAMTYPL